MPAPTASTPPFRLSVGPVAASAPRAPAVLHVQVADNGTKAMHVTASTFDLKGCGQLKISPASFNVAPGHSQSVVITALTNNSDSLAKFSGTTAGGHGFGVSGAIAARMVIGHPAGHCTVKAQLPAHAASGGLPLGIWAAVAVLGAVLLVIVAMAVRSRKNRRAS